MFKALLGVAAAAALSTGCATSVVRETTPGAPVQTAVAEPACTPDATGFWAPALNMRRGDLAARECALRIIARGGTPTTTNQFAEVRRGVRLLHGFYNRRAQRQQMFLDIGAGVTVGSAAAGLEGGLSNGTRQAWGIAAFVPVALSQFNAHEPTRELFHGGALALQLITSRYDRLHAALTLARGATADPGCGRIDNLIAELAPRQGLGPLDRHDTEGLIVGEARRLQQDCLTLAENHRRLDFASTYATQVQAYLAGQFAADVLELDHALLARDRELRYSPMESLGAVAASPLRTVDTILTGDDTQGALDSMKTQIAFGGLNRNLATVRLPPLPSRGAAIAALTASADSIDRSGAVARRNASSPYLVRLRALTQELQGLQARQEFALALVGEYGLAASSDYLTFVYDAPTRTTVITLAPRPVAVPALGAVSTAVGGSAVRLGQ